MNDRKDKGGLPDYRIELGKGLTLAWDVFTYGQPNEANVRRFLQRFCENGGPKEHGFQRVIDQNNGEIIVENIPDLANG